MVVHPTSNHWHGDDGVVIGFSTKGLRQGANNGQNKPRNTEGNIKAQEGEYEDRESAHDGLVFVPDLVPSSSRAKFAYDRAGRVSEE
mmetsp:Transcript_127333/g.249536  ORF Transcript_127333/g.249536 Transcript_127333/m.249536 type:complete len:87 (+) Transcript_127333:121-381(+)